MKKTWFGAWVENPTSLLTDLSNLYFNVHVNSYRIMKQYNIWIYIADWIVQKLLSNPKLVLEREH